MAVKMYDFVERIGCLTIRIPLSGGKAGKGKATTSNVQVFNYKKSTIEKRFPFRLKSLFSKQSAIAKAKMYCMDNIK